MEMLEGKKLVILGVGNKLKGDDGIGSVVVEELTTGEKKLVIDCEEVPEAYSQRVSKFKPDAIVIVDAVDFKVQPGGYFLAKLDDNLQNYAPLSTHKIPLKVLADMFRKETGAEIYLLGIQPKIIEFGSGLSKELEKTKTALVEFLQAL
jgi:hydrogenase 3 maturation protease